MVVLSEYIISYISDVCRRMKLVLHEAAAVQAYVPT